MHSLATVKVINYANDYSLKTLYQRGCKGMFTLFHKQILLSVKIT